MKGDRVIFSISVPFILKKELEQIKTMHKKGLMASWIVLKKRKEKNEKDN